MAFFNRLPIEVITDIINVLDYRSLYNIRLVSKLFASFISPFQLMLAFQIARLRLLGSECRYVVNIPYVMTVLSCGELADKYGNHINTLLPSHLNDYEFGQEVEQVWNSIVFLARYGSRAESPMADCLPCYFCLKHVTWSNFVRSQRRDKRALGHQNCIYRVCNQCVTRKKKWANNDPANIGKVRFRMCERCNKVEEMQRAVPGKGRKKPLHVCDRCHSSRQNGWNARNSLGSMYGRRPGNGDSRCQRCWYLRDEERPAEHEREGRLMCSECFDVAIRAKEPNVTSFGEAEGDELCLELNELC